MELEVTPAFPTLIGRIWIPDADAMNQELRALILAEETRYASLGRSNIGGWHSRPDFLNQPDLSVSALNQWLIWGVRRMITATAGPDAFDGTPSISGWAAICRAGAYHAPHSHPDSAWSGVYYVDPGADTPDRPLSGLLEFLDPRAGVEAVTAPGDPYGEPFRVRPQAGLLVIFPSWLFHWVHPYSGSTPRIAVSFNASPARAGVKSESLEVFHDEISGFSAPVSGPPRIGRVDNGFGVRTSRPGKRKRAVTGGECGHTGAASKAGGATEGPIQSD